MRKVRKILIGCFVCIFLCGIGYLFASPYITAYQMKVAADSKDGDALSQHVDFPMLRKSIKDQLSERFKKKAAKVSDEDPMGAIGTMFGGMIVDKMVDSYVTPEGIVTLMKGQKKRLASGGKSADADQTDPAASKKPFGNASAAYDTFDKFSIVMKDDESDRKLTFVLRRRGLEWKLTEIMLP